MTDVAVDAGRVRAGARRFYVGVALTCLAIAFLSFAPSYFMPMAQGKFRAAPILHIHGMLFFGWTLLFMAQTWLAANGGLVLHRSLGMLGVSLATGMIFTTVAVVIGEINVFEAAGMGAARRAFTWVQISGMAFFAVVFALAVAYVKQPETHKRLMVVATVSLMDAPLARWFALALAPPAPAEGLAPPPPVFIALPPGLIADLILVAAMIYDMRTRGRIHPVYIYGGLALLLVQITRPLIAVTPLWDSVATWVGGIGG